MNHRVAFIILFLTFGTGFALTSERVRQARPDVSFEAREDTFVIAPASTLEVSTLNYRAFAATMMWVRALIYFGEWRYSGTLRPAQHLESYASAIVDLDPQFYPAYEWYNTTSINALQQVGHEDLLRTARFMDRGIEQFPNDGELPFRVGMNFMGYSKGREPAERIKELDLGVAYLKKAVRLGGVPSHIPLTISAMQERRDALQAQQSGAAPSKQSNIDFYLFALANTDDSTQRSRLITQLRELGVPQRDIDARVNESAERLELELEGQRAYLPVDLWMVLTP